MNRFKFIGRDLRLHNLLAVGHTKFTLKQESSFQVSNLVGELIGGDFLNMFAKFINSRVYITCHIISLLTGIH